jgi:signal transduction histidine kinase
MRRILGRIVPDTLGSRIILVLLSGLLAFHLGSLWLHQVDIESLLGTARESQLAERLLATKRVLEVLEPVARDRTTHDLASASLDLHWTAVPTVRLTDEHSPRIVAVRNRLRELVPQFEDADIRLGHSDDTSIEDAPHLLVGAIRLSDGTWLNFSAALFRPTTPDRTTLLSTSAMAIGILLLGLVVVRLIARPLRELAAAADRIGGNGSTLLVPEQGPREVVHAAQAFNRMQARIDQMIADRTQALAAVSHDLRTPIARLRLRASFLDDVELQRQFDADLAEMDAMVGTTLAYLRGDQEQEARRPTDLAAILETLCDDATDAGKDVLYEGPAQARLTGRPLALKRALSNLIDNAVNYGGAAKVRVCIGESACVVHIEDSGPGIPEDQMDSVFEPFRRLDYARERGGSGLGLTIARQAVEAHGGSITLSNLPEGGLRATVVLPRKK